jgi:hypothetical protein
MAREVNKDETGQVAVVNLYDTDGAPLTSQAYNAAGLEICAGPIGGTRTQITLSEENWTETAGPGEYEVDLDDSLFETLQTIRITGEITGGIVIGETIQVVNPRLTAAEQQAAAAAAIEAAGLTLPSGEYTQTVTVKDGDGVAIQGATVAILSGDTLIDQQDTDASGVALPACDAGTFTLRVTYSGLYTSSSETIVVTSAAAHPVTLERISYTPSTEPDSVTVRWRVRGADRQVAEGATVYVSIQDGPGTDGEIWSGTADTDTSDVNGYVEFANVPIPCTLLVKAGSAGIEREVVIPSDATSPYDAGELTNQDVD